MNKNVKLWVKALRSGKYKQTSNHLADIHGYCCMGVACEVFIDNGGELEKLMGTGYFTYDKQSAVLPPAVREWLNLKTSTGLVRSSPIGVKVELTALNDTGASFEQIADIIESTPELFV